MQLYISIDTATTGKNFFFVCFSSNGSDFHMVNDPSITFYALSMHMLTLGEIRHRQIFKKNKIKHYYLKIYSLLKILKPFKI